LAGCVSQSEYDKVVAENQQLRAQNQQTSQQLATSQQHVGNLREAMVLVVNSDLAFKSGSWELTEEGKGNIAAATKKLAPTQTQHLIVTGYTDDTPIGAGLKKQGVATNQELSEKRADAVMQYMISQGANPSLLTAQGMGEQNPVAPNDNATDRAKNRRVEVSLAESGT
jgi:chemotaxis protein MotB